MAHSLNIYSQVILPLGWVTHQITHKVNIHLNHQSMLVPPSEFVLGSLRTWVSQQASCKAAVGSLQQISGRTLLLDLQEKPLLAHHCQAVAWQGELCSVQKPLMWKQLLGQLLYLSSLEQTSSDKHSFLKGEEKGASLQKCWRCLNIYFAACTLV